MKVLVTGADGFVGSWLVPRLLKGEHDVTAAVFSADTAARVAALGTLGGAIDVVTLDVRDAESVRRVCERDLDAIVHLAAVSSGGDAQRDPGAAWEVNAAGTARLADYFAQASDEPVTRIFLVVSSLEVYGAGMARRWAEEDRPRPISPYAASKLGAELAALEVPPYWTADRRRPRRRAYGSGTGYALRRPGVRAASGRSEEPRRAPRARGEPRSGP